MASESSKHVVTNKTDINYIQTRGWVHLWAQLESNADGTNSIGYGGELAEVESGATISHFVAPDTRIQIKSTSVDGAAWAILITEMTFIDTIIAALCNLGSK